MPKVERENLTGAGSDKYYICAKYYTFISFSPCNYLVRQELLPYFTDKETKAQEAKHSSE